MLMKSRAAECCSLWLFCTRRAATPGATFATRWADSRGGRPMKRILLSAALISIAAVPALAADLPVKAPMAAPIVAPVFNWTGFYIGVDGGGTWGRAQITHSAIVPAGAFDIDAAAGTAGSSPGPGPRGWGLCGPNWHNLQVFPKW